MDLTLKNPKIASYFNGTSDLVPTSELIYVHTHVIQDNFLSDIEVLVTAADKKLLGSKNPAELEIVQQLKVYAEKFASLIYKIDDETAPAILEVLRNIYQICKQIIR